MTSRQAKIQEDTHFRIMRILQENPDLTQRELAEKLGMSVGGLNYCLNALMDKGLVKMQNFSNSKNKFKYVYLLTPMGIAEKVALTTRFLGLKMEEYEALKLEIEALKLEIDPPSQGKIQKACSKSPLSSYGASQEHVRSDFLRMGFRSIPCQ
jgi:EPS-associated MarR family transcriptional regulator